MTATSPRLDVMICTFGPDCLDRIQAMKLPRVDGVRYIVSAQAEPMDVPPALADRPDIDIHFTPSRGLSNNRNHALSLVTAPYCYVCDDDLTLHPEALRQLIDTFDAHPDIDIITMRQTGNPRVYPPKARSIATTFKNYFITSIEIAMRTASFRATGVNFNPLLGIGAPYLGAGEEDMLLYLLTRRHRLNGWYFPITIAHHYGPTTGERPGVPGQRAQGAALMLFYPYTFIPRVLLKALRTHHTPFLRSLKHLMQGGLYALRHRRLLFADNITNHARP